MHDRGQLGSTTCIHRQLGMHDTRSDWQPAQASTEQITDALSNQLAIGGECRCSGSKRSTASKFSNVSSEATTAISRPAM